MRRAQNAYHIALCSQASRAQPACRRQRIKETQKCQQPASPARHEEEKAKRAAASTSGVVTGGESNARASRKESVLFVRLRQT